MEWISGTEKFQEESALFFICFYSTIKKLKTGMLKWQGITLPVCEATGVNQEVTKTPQHPLLYWDGIHCLVTNGDEPQAALKSPQGTSTSRARAVTGTAWMNMESHTRKKSVVMTKILHSASARWLPLCLQTHERRFHKLFGKVTITHGWGGGQLTRTKVFSISKA